MELHAHKRFGAVADAFVGAVVRVEKPRLPIRRQGFFVDGGGTTLKISDVVGWAVVSLSDCHAQSPSQRFGIFIQR